MTIMSPVMESRVPGRRVSFAWRVRPIRWQMEMSWSSVSQFEWESRRLVLLPPGGKNFSRGSDLFDVDSLGPLC